VRCSQDVYALFMTEIMPALMAQLPLIATLLFAGAAAGLLAGLFGVGGGIVIVPALFSAFTVYGYSADTAMHIALGSSLATIIPTGLSSARSHWKRGSVDRAVLRALVPATALGAILGALLAGFIPGQGLTLVFAFFALLVGALMLRGQKGFALVRQFPSGAGKHALGGSIGFFSAMLGIGGGTISVPTLAACGFAMTRAIGTGAALGLAIAIPGAIGFVVAGWYQTDLPPYSLGYVSLLAVLLIAPLSVAFAPLGARLAHRLPELWLRRGFALFLLLMSGKMMMRALGS
jgi:uncharacterized membrane protein YfcA